MTAQRDPLPLADERAAFLRTVPMFAEIADDAVAAIAAELDEAVVPAGHLLAGPGDGHLVLILVSGLADARSAPGAERVVGPGTVVAMTGRSGTSVVEVRARTPVVAYAVAADRLARWLPGGRARW